MRSGSIHSGAQYHNETTEG
jgi:hypothetical protein